MSRFPGKEILYGVRDSSKVMEIEGGAPQRHPFLSKSIHKTFFFFGSLGGWDLGGGPVDLNHEFLWFSGEWDVSKMVVFFKGGRVKIRCFVEVRVEMGSWITVPLFFAMKVIT